jgi:roadblock/LC7 domain-containing protein
MRANLQTYFSLLFVLYLCNVGVAQSTYRTAIEISEQASAALTNYQVELTVNTAGLIAQGKMNSDGSDLRFYSDSCLTTALSHWVESGMNTVSTLVWVLVPAIPANATTTIYMGYGDPSAVSMSSFASTFPNAIISGGNPLSLTGNIVTDWFQLDAADILTVINGSTLSINARKIIINGTVNGNGAGYTGGASGSGTGNVGGGPGGGTPSNPMNSGCGGGSYGGVGGTGGFDSGDTPGAGGPIYGTASGTDFDMGSGGAASDLNFGGAGGGALLLSAAYINIAGTINMNGTSAQQPGGGRGAGGGAGGSVVSIAKDIVFSGVINANGGSGSIGTSTANDDGGSGSGGRIKFIATGVITNTGTTSVAGGPVGTNGTGGAPTIGATGTVFSGSFVAIDDLVISQNPEISLNFTASISGSLVACDGETITLSGGVGYTSYLWNTAQTTASINVTTSGTYVLTAEAPFGCGFSDVVSVIVNFNPSPVINTAPTASFCASSSVLLDAGTGTGFASYNWSNGATTQTNTVTSGGVYTVTVSNANGCTASANVVVTENPLPVINIASTASFCVSSSVILDAGAGFSTYSWSNGTTTQTNTITSGGAYTVTVTNANGCTASANVNVTENPLPVLNVAPTVSFCSSSSAILDAGAGFSSYNWSNGTTTQTNTVTSGGTYSITVTNANGCANSAPITVTENPLPILTATSTGNDGTIDLTVASGTPGFTYLWDNGAGTNQDPTGLASNTYSVTVTDAAGCTSTLSITIQNTVGTNELAKAFHVFPNPTAGVFNIQTNQAFDVTTGVIYDNLGRIVQEIDFNGMQNISIDLSNYEPGIYALVMLVNNELVNLRVVVQ